MSDAVSLTYDKLNKWRGDAVALYSKLGYQVPERFTCDDCGVRTMCRHVYAPANIGGECAAEVKKKAVHKVTTDFNLKQ